MVANLSEDKNLPHWYENLVSKTLEYSTNQTIKENVSWEKFQQDENLVEQYIGLITEIDNDVVTVVFKDLESGISEAYNFSIDKFDFSINVNDSIILNQYSDMIFKFIKYSETFSERIEDRKFAKKISSYEENYDI